MSESFEKTEDKEPEFLNNFFLNLPGGQHRTYYGMNPEKDRMMDAIDKLLQEEFPDIKPQEILESFAKSSQLITEVWEGESSLSDEEQDVKRKEARELSQHAQDLLRPLFKRLEEMGFKRALLMQ